MLVETQAALIAKLAEQIPEIEVKDQILYIIAVVPVFPLRLELPEGATVKILGKNYSCTAGKSIHYYGGYEPEDRPP